MVHIFPTVYFFGLSKKIVREYDLSYIMRKDGMSFSRKYDFFLWAENER